MSFHFHRLKLKNWLVYNDAEIVFPDFEQGNNLIVVNGRNGFGKTSLLKALQFLFYDEYKRSDHLNIWNERAREEGEGSLEVLLKFEYGEHLYTIARGVNFGTRSDLTEPTVSSYVKLWRDGKEIQGQVEDQIMQIIPRECLQFVFFDGAEITRYAHKQYEDGIREAIELMLGIPVVRNLAYDLEKLEAELGDKQTELLGQKEENHQLIQEVDGYEQQIEAYRDKKASLQEKDNSLEATLTELSKEASTIDATEAERETLREKEKREGDIKRRLETLNEEIDKAIVQAPIHMLQDPMQRLLQDTIGKQAVNTRRTNLKQLRSLLEEILEDGTCVCGRPVEDVEENHLLREISRLETLSSDIQQSGLLSAAQSGELNGLLKQIRANPIDGKRIFDRRSMYIQELEEVKTDIYRLTEKLENHEIVEVQELHEQIKRLKDRQIDIRAEIQNLNASIEKADKKCQDAQRQLDAIASSMDQAQGITHTLAEIRKLHATVQEYVDELVERMRQRIEDITSEIFLSITNKPREYAGIRVRGDYTLEVYRHDDTVIDNTQLSAGEKEVLAYSFITALNLSTPTPTPFVMDTPFGHLDSGHRDSLLESLPKMPVQVMLLATDRDLPPQERDRLDKYICAEYEIKRDQYKAISTITEIQ